MSLQVLTYAFLHLFVYRLAYGLGYLLMDELSQAIAQFYPSSSGGASNLPGPSGPTPWIPPVAAPDTPNSDSLSNELPCLNMPTPQFEELQTFTRELQEELPLIPDEERQQEIERILRGRYYAEIDHIYDSEAIELFSTLEIKIEFQLRQEGFSDESINETRSKWRYIAFTDEKTGKFIKKPTIRSNLKKSAITDSGPYKRLRRGFKNLEINLVKKTPE